MAKRRPQKDRTSLVISAVIHILLIGGIAYWAYKSGKFEQMRQAVLQYVRSDKKQPPAENKPQQQKAAPAAKLPPINQGVAPTPGSGTRRAVASDAPAAAGGESFFQDTRQQGEGPSTASGGPNKDESKVILVAPPKVKAPEKPKPLLSSAGPSNVKALLQERSKAAAAIESYGADQISKSSVSDAGDIVARVSGATVVEGKYAVIRGLTDRYSAATLNGAELPSADPYRRSAALDMFPAKIIDRVTVTKTFTPDQPGSFTGGNINIITRSFPDRPFASLEVGLAYNTQATGNEKFLSYKGGDNDWLGMDDGTRGLDDAFWDSDLSIPTWRQALGRPIDTTSTRPSVQRNLKDAKEIDRLTKLAGPAEFRGTPDAPGPNMAFLAAAGDTAYLFGRPVGVFFSMPYGRGYSHYDQGEVTRVTYSGLDDLSLEKEFEETKSTTEVNWAGTASLAYQILPEHQLGMNFIYNQYSEDSVRFRKGVDVDNDLQNLDQWRLQWVERNLTSWQFRGNHAFPDLGNLRADWLATITDTTQDEPDTRFYYTDGGRWGVSGLEPKQPTRYWRELEEHNENYKADLALPFTLRAAETGEVKAGVFSSKAERNYRERILQYDTPSNEAPYDGDPNDLLTPGNLGADVTRNGNLVTYDWSNFLTPPTYQSFYTGESEIPAAYAMLDVPVVPSVRLIGGARFEKTDIKTVSFTTAPSEGVRPGETNSPPPLQQDDLLPAVGLVWAASPRVNLRLNYGETLARPSFRELAGVRTYDPVLDEFIVGNPNLQISSIKNYDARIEWFPRAGEILSVGLFYKDLRDVIEKQFISSAGDIITFVNRSNAIVYGVEFEARKNLDTLLGPSLRNWSLGGNLSLIYSEEDVTDQDKLNHVRPEELGDTRPLADQSPYIINLDLTYDNPAWGTTFSTTYNIFGPRLTIASLNSPDIYEQPAPLLDVVVSQRIGRNMRLKFAARNLLDPEIERTYGEESQAIYSSYTRGRTYSLSLNYEF